MAYERVDKIAFVIKAWDGGGGDIRKRFIVTISDNAIKSSRICPAGMAQWLNVKI